MGIFGFGGNTPPSRTEISGAEEVLSSSVSRETGVIGVELINLG